ncbi:MAG: transporter substrate-binding domain-containing protein, partial [Pseudomonadota bacterium]
MRLIFCLLVLLASAAAAQNLNESARTLQPWVGDLDGMLDRRAVRVLVPYSRTGFFIDGGRQRGLFYEVMTGFEDQLNEQHADGLIRINVVFVPTTRERLIPALQEGLGDIIAADLTVTPERSEQVQFTTPLGRNVRELLVRHADAREPESLEDLAGEAVFIAAYSSYAEHLSAVNQRLQANGLDAIDVRESPDHFQTE